MDIDDNEDDLPEEMQDLIEGLRDEGKEVRVIRLNLNDDNSDMNLDIKDILMQAIGSNKITISPEAQANMNENGMTIEDVLQKILQSMNTIH